MNKRIAAASVSGAFVFILFLLACERGERNPTTMRVGHDDASHSWRRRRDFALNAALLW